MREDTIYITKKWLIYPEYMSFLQSILEDLQLNHKMGEKRISFHRKETNVYETYKKVLPVISNWNKTSTRHHYPDALEWLKLKRDLQLSFDEHEK